MDQLWAPWRLSYVRSEKTPDEKISCFICRGLSLAEDRENLIVCRTGRSVVLLNRYPYNNGHLLVSPQAHKARFEELSEEEMIETCNTVRRFVRILDHCLKPDGYNIGLNLGSAAGAGLPQHLHWHIVPRWASDTNFMPVLADTRVIVQSLDSLYQLVTAQLVQDGLSSGAQGG